MLQGLGQELKGGLSHVNTTRARFSLLTIHSKKGKERIVTTPQASVTSGFFIPGESAEAKKARHSELFRELRRRVENANGKDLLKAHDSWFFARSVIVHIFIGLTIYLGFQATTVLQWCGLGVLAGFCSVQIGILGHDLGHYQYLRNSGKKSDLFRLYLGNFCLGFAWSWRVNKHFQHHTSPNQIGEDPDIQFDWLAFAKEQLEEKGQDRLTQWQLRNQWWLFWLYLPGQAFNARISSIKTLKNETPRREDYRIQMRAIKTHFVVYALVLVSVGYFVGPGHAFGFFLTHQGFHGLYNSAIFASNHKGMKTYLRSEVPTFLEFQILTSRDVKGYWWFPDWLLTFLQGGLNHQTAHHLFPLASQQYLGKIQVIIEEFCLEKGIPYRRDSIFKAYLDVGRNFKEVSNDLISSPMGA